MSSVAVGIVCKTPAPGFSKTRLSPPLRPDECAELSACFIRDFSNTIGELMQEDVTGYAVYTPAGTEDTLRALLPRDFRLLLQSDGDLETRLVHATRALLGAGHAGHAGLILVNADSPTLPASILRAAVAAIRHEDAVVISPALDGGYTLIGLSKTHIRIFAGIPWSTPQVYQETIRRAAQIGLPVVTVPGWYDVDDAASLALLESELAGAPLLFTQNGLIGANAPATRAFLAKRTALL